MKARGLFLISLVMEGAAGGSGQQDGRLFKLIGARSRHDPLVPIAGFRAAVRVVEQEQRGGEIRRQFQIARDGPFEGGAEIGQLIVDCDWRPWLP